MAVLGIRNILLLPCLITLFGTSDSKEVKVAIIGAGIGGTSAAYDLAQQWKQRAEDSGDELSIDVFDESGQIGGRLRTVDLAGRTYEIGGSVIHPKNKEMTRLVHEAGLKRREEPHKIGERPTGIFSIHSGGVVTLEKWSYLSSFQLAWRYGPLSLWNMFSFISEFLQNFLRIYKPLDEGESAEHVQDLLDWMNPDQREDPDSTMYNTLGHSLRDELLKKRLSHLLIDELVTAAVRTNYGQMPGQVHAFVGAVALAGATDGLWAIQGGNKRLAEKLLQLSGAQFRAARVNKVYLTPDGQYEVSYVFNNNPETVTYDKVILAVPEINFELKNVSDFDERPFKARRFHQTVATLVHGTLNTSLIGSNTAVNFFVDPESSPKINSVALNAPVDYDPHREGDGQDLPTVWKVFSQDPLTSEELNSLFTDIKDTAQVNWLAYPHYQVPGQPLLTPFKLHSGLYHLNSIEWMASAMECSAVAARNVVNGVLNELFGNPIKQKSAPIKEEF